MMTALLQTTYFGPVQWYQKLYRYDHCLIEQYDSYQKQTYRNRCIVATANGLQALTVPVEVNGEKCLVKDVRISDHNNWRRVHWNALMSAYSESPFFDYYADGNQTATSSLAPIGRCSAVSTDSCRISRYSTCCFVWDQNQFFIYKLF